ncbi:hypothetical protein COB28_00325 [Candidatus Dependentiae bacterium]|nr:MAG: hypothetical protein COB28_00325 [Candidatus Dependentiae bacterium]
MKKFFQTLKTDDRPVIQNFYTHFLKKEQNEQCNIFQTFIDIADLNLIEKLKMSKSAYIANLNSFLDELDSMVETLGRVKKNSKNLQSKYKKVNNKNSVTDFDLDRVLDSINKLSSKSRSAEAKSSFEHVKNAIEKHKKEHARDKKERPLQKELMISRERLVQYKVFCEHTEMVEDHLISNFTVSHAKHWGILLSVVTVAALSTHYKYKKSQEKYLESLHSKLDFIGMSRDKKKEFLSRIDTFYIQWLPYSIRKLIGEDSLDKEIDELYQVVKNKKLDFIHS